VSFLFLSPLVLKVEKIIECALGSPQTLNLLLDSFGVFFRITR